MTFCPTWERQSCTKEYDKYLLNTMLTRYEDHSPTYGWCVAPGGLMSRKNPSANNKPFFHKYLYMYKQDLALNNLQRLVCHKTQSINQSDKQKYLLNSSSWAFFCSVLVIERLRKSQQLSLISLVPSPDLTVGTLFMLHIFCKNSSTEPIPLKVFWPVALPRRKSSICSP